MSMKFGLALPQGTLMELAGITDPVEAYETMTQVALTAEEVGFGSLWLSDAFWAGDPSQNLFECWTTVAALARDTRRARIGQMVTYSGLRQPALLAQMASTVDVMSHGRLTLGIGLTCYHKFGRQQMIESKREEQRSRERASRKSENHDHASIDFVVATVVGRSHLW